MPPSLWSVEALTARTKFVVWFSLEILIFGLVFVDAIVRISQGAEFSKGDIIFIAVVIGACVLAIAITIMCHVACRKRDDKGDSEDGLIAFICCQDGVQGKMKPVHGELSGSDCAICLDEKDKSKAVVQITCNHTYHRACITKCLEVDKSAKCPQCRRHPRMYPATERFAALVRAIVNKQRTQNKEDESVREQLNQTEDTSNTDTRNVELPADIHIPMVQDV